MKEVDKKVALNQLISLQNSIQKMLDQELKYFVEPIPEPTREVITYYYKLGGKKLRPSLFLSVAKAFNSEENLAPHALVIELIHTMSLYHDDVIDEAKERRGAPTVHQKWDKPTAIVAGDILHSVIHGHILMAIQSKRIRNSELSIKFLKDLIYIIEVKIGAAVLEEMHWAKSVDMPSLEVAIDINSGKTAPLFAFSASAAAYLSDQDLEISNAMYELGQHLGKAFQLLDDVSDYFDNDKDIGGDLREDKKTPILILSYEEDPDYVNSLRRNSDVSLSDIIEFRIRFRLQFEKILSWAEKEISGARQLLNKIPENIGKERIRAFFSLLDSKIFEFKSLLS